MSYSRSQYAAAVKSAHDALHEESRAFVKSPGSKRLQVDTIASLLPADPIAYHEPFVGGGSLFFRKFSHVRPAYLSDTNERLIITYRAVRDYCAAVIQCLRRMRYDRDEYYATRDEFNRHWLALPRARVAALFIYLSRCGMNGLYRENAAGEYNVPFGQHKNPRICDEDNLRACSAALQGVSIECEDFEAAMRRVEGGKDPGRVALYADPVYIPLTDGRSFTRYGRNGFHLDDHVRLAAAMRSLDHRGIAVVASNSDTWVTRDIFRGFKLKQVVAPRTIGAGSDRRAPALELLIHNRRGGR